MYIYIHLYVWICIYVISPLFSIYMTETFSSLDTSKSHMAFTSVISHLMEASHLGTFSFTHMESGIRLNMYTFQS